MSDEPPRSTEQQIRERAYELWDQAGRPHGRDEEFWQQARDEIERELLKEQNRTINSPPGSECLS